MIFRSVTLAQPKLRLQDSEPHRRLAPTRSRLGILFRRRKVIDVRFFHQMRLLLPTGLFIDSGHAEPAGQFLFHIRQVQTTMTEHYHRVVHQIGGFVNNVLLFLIVRSGIVFTAVFAVALANFAIFTGGLDQLSRFFRYFLANFRHATIEQCRRIRLGRRIVAAVMNDLHQLVENGIVAQEFAFNLEDRGSCRLFAASRGCQNSYLRAMLAGLE